MLLAQIVRKELPSRVHWDLRPTLMSALQRWVFCFLLTGYRRLNALIVRIIIDITLVHPTLDFEGQQIRRPIHHLFRIRLPQNLRVAAHPSTRAAIGLGLR